MNHHSLRSGTIFQITPPFNDPIRKTVFTMFSRPLEKALKFHILENLYRDIIASNSAGVFLNRVLNELNVTYDIDRSDLEKIPSTGPAIVVANHPFGAIEGVILASILTSIRPDVKLMANYILGRIPEMRPFIIEVNPFGSRKAVTRNMAPLRQCLRWVESNGLLGIFPAGEVAHIDIKKRVIADPEWNKSIARLVRRAKAPIVPVYFDGANSTLFQMLGLIHPGFRTAMLPREFLNKSNRDIKVKIGKVIPFNKIEHLDSDIEVIEYLRLKTYIQQQRIPGQSNFMKKKIKPQVKTIAHDEPVISACDKNLLKNDISKLSSKNLLIEKGEYCVYQAVRKEIPNIINEIGRLREITFRAAGEGTGKAIDLDIFDDYYIHLFMWHKSKGEVVGSYRLGKTDVILREQGMKGLYTRTLFKYNRKLIGQISPALELGRSFICQEYQRDYSSLHLLWKGIGRFVVLNPKYKTLFGPVSISSGYQSGSMQLMVNFLKANNFDTDLARLVKPKVPMKLRRSNKWNSKATCKLVNDIKEVSSLIAEIETNYQGVPVLLRHYLKLGGKLLCFNIDPDFSHVLDGLILVDLTRTDKRILDRYIGKTDSVKFLELHKTEQDRLGTCPVH